jgi:hypothetical protein
MIRDGGHFAYVTPLAFEFPYRIPEDKPEPKEEGLRKVEGEQVGDGTANPGEAEGEKQPPKEIDVEEFLASLEPSLEHPAFDGRDAYTSPQRRKLLSKAELVSYAQTCIDDVLPELDVGDASGDEKTRKAREEFVEVLSGRAVILRKGEEGQEQQPFTPFSHCYGGHQFGSWAGQLGDGRAICICTSSVLLARNVSAI